VIADASRSFQRGVKLRPYFPGEFDVGPAAQHNCVRVGNAQGSSLAAQLFTGDRAVVTGLPVVRSNRCVEVEQPAMGCIITRPVRPFLVRASAARRAARW
jgi:hypothetical protein